MAGRRHLLLHGAGMPMTKSLRRPTTEEQLPFREVGRGDNFKAEATSDVRVRQLENLPVVFSGVTTQWRRGCLHGSKDYALITLVLDMPYPNQDLLFK